MKHLAAAALLLLACPALLVASGDPALPMKAKPAEVAKPAPAAKAAPATKPAAAPAAKPAEAGAVATTLPDGRVLLRKFIDACGGSAAFGKVNNIKIDGTISVPAQGLSGNLTIYQSRPDRVLAVTTLGPITMKEGYDGKTGWADDPIQGPRILQGAELEQLKTSGGEIEIFGYANPDDYFKSARTLERTTFQGHDAWKVALETKSGDVMTGYFDPTTSLQLGVDDTVEAPTGTIAVTVAFSEWKDFSGMKAPTKLSQKMVGMDTSVTIDSIQINLAELPSFGPPAEVTEASE